jgi:AcrR family transcriptional regulator
MSSVADGQKSRSLATQKALMQAAVTLVARKGIANISIREIVKEAGQKNESALQYHFKNLQGLITAIQQSREKEVQEKRSELLDQLLDVNKRPSLRDLCKIMILPSFSLAKVDPDHRQYIIAFSHELALSNESAFSLVSKKGAGGISGQKTGELLREALPHLDENTYLRRMDSAVRLTSISMGNHARQRNAFRGKAGDLFLCHLLDTIVGLLGAPISDETKAIGKKVKKK